MNPARSILAEVVPEPMGIPFPLMLGDLASGSTKAPLIFFNRKYMYPTSDNFKAIRLLREDPSWRIDGHISWIAPGCPGRVGVFVQNDRDGNQLPKSTETDGWGKQLSLTADLNPLFYR